MYTKDMLIGDLLDNRPELASVFMRAGMHCLDCPSARGETIEEACQVHGVDSATFLASLNHHCQGRKT